MNNNGQASVRDNENNIEYMQYAHCRIDTMKDNIYIRASIVIAAIAFLLPQGALIFINIFKEYHDRDVLLIITTTIGFIFFILMIISFSYAISCLAPLKSRFQIYEILIKSTSGNDDLSRIPVFTAFPHITEMDREHFETAVMDLNKEKILHQLANAIYTLSFITEKRYYKLRNAYVFLYSSIFFFIVLIGIYIYMYW